MMMAETNPNNVDNNSNSNKGIAGRINYAQWDKVASDLVEETEQEEAQEAQQERQKLGLDGKYARSEAEAQEREKAAAARKVKETLDGYQAREEAVVQTLSGLFGPADNDGEREESKETEKKTIRITRNDMEAGTRVLRLQDTSGSSVQHSTLVLTQDLSLLESQMAVNPKAKSYEGDAENAVPQQQHQPRRIFGLIKLFLQNVHNCTILVKCKLISGVVEVHRCSNVTIKIMGPEATVATVQVDMSETIALEFHDAPSGKNQQQPVSLFWGDDADDRVFHAGVRDLSVKIYRDNGMLEQSCTADYQRDGATAVGNATAEEMQFVTSVVDGALVTESVVRSGSTTGSQVRAMTEREVEAERVKREKATNMALDKAEAMIQIRDKDGNPVVTKQETSKEEASAQEEEVVSPSVQAIVDECQQNKAKGNEAFGAGEYGQAILLYSLALDKAQELSPAESSDSNNQTSSSLFPCDVVYCNRAACFLKLGQHEKAEQDAASALKINPDNIKALFRQGLALHAMGRYQDALPLLAKASKLEPKNTQIQQALKFCEVRMEQEHRKRMAG